MSTEWRTPDEPLARANEQRLERSKIVEQKTETWPLQYLLPGGAYIP